MKLNSDKEKMIKLLKNNEPDKEKERQKFLEYSLRKIEQNKQLMDKED